MILLQIFDWIQNVNKIYASATDEVIPIWITIKDELIITSNHKMILLYKSISTGSLQMVL